MKQSFYLLYFVFFACSSYREFDANIVAKDYCNCMRSHNPQNTSSEYWYAKKVCDGLLTEKYYFFRFLEVDTGIGTEQSASFNDSLRHFHNRLDDALRADCCEFVLNCPNEERKQP
jgi:hypothetical protein